MSPKRLIDKSFIAAGVIALALAATAAPALAVAKHTFDPVLSLRGDCSTNALDEVPDPGLCPMPPGVPGVDHPLKAFEQPCGTATDLHGDIYVASAGAGTSGAGTEGRIDVFDPQGNYLTEILDEFQPCSLAVDSNGNVYVAEYASKDAVRFDANVYPPTKGSGYGPRTVLHEPDLGDFCGGSCTSVQSVAVDPSNDHLYLALGLEILEYDSAANGNALLREGIGEGLSVRALTSVAVYGKTHQIYASSYRFSAGNPGDPSTSRVVVFNPAATEIECEIDGTASPQGGFGWTQGEAAIAVDQSNGDVYVGDVISGPGHAAVDQFDSACQYLGQVEHSFRKVPVGSTGLGLAVDTPCLDALGEPCGGKTYDSPNKGNLYVGQGKSASTDRLYAFKPKPIGPPEVEAQGASEASETEAVLSAQLNPDGLATRYRFEYTTQAEFEAHGYEGARSTPAPEADAGAGGSFEAVSEPIFGLKAGTAYRFRLVASNCEAEEATAGECLTAGEGNPGGEGEDASFATFVHEAGLPDDRAYELVTPPDTAGHIPTMAAMGLSGSNVIPTPLVTSDGESVLFGTKGGSIPALGGGGFYDTYEARRTPSGWQSRFNGLDATQTQGATFGGFSADHGSAFWRTEGTSGSLGRPDGKSANYLRLPDGRVEPIGIGSLGVDLGAHGRWISEAGDRVIFSTQGSVDGNPIKLEPDAPPDGTGAIYERTPGGETHVLSLLPGEITPNQNAEYQGASVDGSAVAFMVPGSLYLRLDDAETKLVAEGNLAFGGISTHGERVTYLDVKSKEKFPQPPRGEIFSYDAASEEIQQVGSSEESTLVNVSADGTHVYFLSPERLDGGNGVLGGDNLYLWDAGSGAVRFVATVTERDVLGEAGKEVSETMTDGLGLWTTYVAGTAKGRFGGPGADPSLSTDHGSVLLFESRAKLGAYENAGHAEIYRFDADAEPDEALICVSCSPNGEAASSDAQLQSPAGGEFDSLPPLNSLAIVGNLTADGKRAFFQSGDRLAARDTDGRIDVYEWQARGTGGCERTAGCIHLISGGRSADDDYFFAATPSGSDVFFLSGDTLVPQDPDRTPSIYDARESGGFPPPSPPPGECLGEACQPVVSAPDIGAPATAGQKPGNPGRGSKQRCPKGKRAVGAKGKSRCVGRHPAHKQKRTRNHKRRAAR